MSQSRVKQWFFSSYLAILFFLLFLFYHIKRRQIVISLGYDASAFNLLYYSNKALAITAVILISISFIMGPIARFFKKFSKYVNYRKELGLMGFIVALIHIYIGLFLLPYHFPLAFFAKYWVSFVISIIALILFSLVAFHSKPSSIKKLGHKKWINIQRLSYLGMVLVGLHVLFLGKYQSWPDWFKYTIPKMPPGALIPIVAICLALIIRAVVYLMNSKNKKYEKNVKENKP